MVSIILKDIFNLSFTFTTLSINTTLSYLLEYLKQKQTDPSAIVLLNCLSKYSDLSLSIYDRQLFSRLVSTVLSSNDPISFSFLRALFRTYLNAHEDQSADLSVLSELIHKYRAFPACNAYTLYSLGKQLFVRRCYSLAHTLFSELAALPMDLLSEPHHIWLSFLSTLSSAELKQESTTQGMELTSALDFLQLLSHHRRMMFQYDFLSFRRDFLSTLTSFRLALLSRLNLSTDDASLLPWLSPFQSRFNLLSRRITPFFQHKLASTDMAIFRAFAAILDFLQSAIVDFPLAKSTLADHVNRKINHSTGSCFLSRWIQIILDDEELSFISFINHLLALPFSYPCIFFSIS